jgi:hypothetical protein
LIISLSQQFRRSVVPLYSMSRLSELSNYMFTASAYDRTACMPRTGGTGHFRHRTSSKCPCTHVCATCRACTSLFNCLMFRLASSNISIPLGSIMFVHFSLVAQSVCSFHASHCHHYHRHFPLWVVDTRQGHSFALLQHHRIVVIRGYSQ